MREKKTTKEDRFLAIAVKNNLLTQEVADNILDEQDRRVFLGEPHFMVGKISGLDPRAIDLNLRVQKRMREGKPQPSHIPQLSSVSTRNKQLANIVVSIGLLPVLWFLRGDFNTALAIASFCEVTVASVIQYEADRSIFLAVRAAVRAGIIAAVIFVAAFGLDAIHKLSMSLLPSDGTNLSYLVRAKIAMIALTTSFFLAAAYAAWKYICAATAESKLTAITDLTIEVDYILRTKDSPMPMQKKNE
jgi:hypothetical protein